jgi:hypothetical protein
MRNRTVILAAFALAGFMGMLLLANPGKAPRKQRAQRIQGVNVIQKFCFTLETTNAPVHSPTDSR